MTWQEREKDKEGEKEGREAFISKVGDEFCRQRAHSAQSRGFASFKKDIIFFIALLCSHLEGHVGDVDLLAAPLSEELDVWQVGDDHGGGGGLGGGGRALNLLVPVLGHGLEGAEEIGVNVSERGISEAAAPKRGAKASSYGLKMFEQFSDMV